MIELHQCGDDTNHVQISGKKIIFLEKLQHRVKHPVMNI